MGHVKACRKTKEIGGTTPLTSDLPLSQRKVVLFVGNSSPSQEFHKRCCVFHGVLGVSERYVVYRFVERAGGFAEYESILQ